MATRGLKLNISIPEPDLEMQAYPAEAVHVRNTFIHIASPAASQNRASLTCPSKYIGRLHDTFRQEETESRRVEHQDSRPVLCLASILDEQVPCTPDQLSRAVFLPSSFYGTPPKQISPLQAHACGMNYEGACGMAAASAFPGPELLAPTLGFVAQQHYDHHSLYLHESQHDLVCTQAIAASSQVPQCALPATLVAPPMAPPSLMSPCELQMPVHPPPAISMSVPTQPAPGSAELPSIGSQDHHSGECKPCAFLYSKGCENGAVCKFCHLCDAGEKKRRQKVKKSSFNLGGA